jgi:hypothetical protein
MNCCDAATARPSAGRSRTALSRTGGTGAWVMVGLHEDYAGNPHARMESANDHTRVITIAPAALRDRRLYRRLHEIEARDDDTRDEWVKSGRAEPGEPA